ncbi:MAG: hypothetical protein AB7S77_11775 [Desulfatirhabdiaceae bacterium]
MPDINRFKFVANICLIGMFAVACYLPLMKTIVTPSASISQTEKRKLAEAPRLELSRKSIQSFPFQFESYFKDHFGYRDLFIFLNSYISVKWLGVSPVSGAIIGKDGWFYWNKNRLSEDFRGANPMTPIEMEHWKTVIEDRQEWLAAQGIEYVLGITPEKQTIYPEYLPDHLQAQRGITRLTRLEKYLKENSDVQLIDWKTPLLAGKRDQQIYYRTDTHWNFRGGFIAYQALMDRLTGFFPDIVARPRSFFQERLIADHEGGDLVIMMGLQHVFLEDQPIYQPQFICSGRWKYDVALADRGSYAMGCKTQTRVAIVFRDSYFNFILPFLSEHFGKIIYIWDQYNHTMVKQLIRDIQPDLVIEEILERFLIYDAEDVEGLKAIRSDLAPERFNRANLTYAAFDRKSGFPVTPVNDLDVAPDNAGLILKSAGEDPQLLLPDCIPDSARSLFIKIQITSPTNTELQIFYRTPDAMLYSEKKSVIQSLKQGFNIIHLYIPERDYLGPLRLDPGKQPGTYVLHSMEIRGVASEAIRQTSEMSPKSES